MKKFTINIWAYDHHAKFKVESNDDPISLEQSIVDKLGENDIKWEYLGASYSSELNRITYEEVMNGGDNATTGDPLYKEEGTRSSMGAGASERG